MIINELWGKKPTKLKEDFSPINEEGVVIGDHIVVSGRVQGQGDVGQVVELGRGGNFVVVKMDDGAIRSFQTSDVRRMNNDEEDDDLLGGRHYSDWDDDLDEHGGGIGPKQHWQRLVHEPYTTEGFMAQGDRLPNTQGPSASEKIRQKNSPVASIVQALKMVNKTQLYDKIFSRYEEAADDVAIEWLSGDAHELAARDFAIEDLLGQGKISKRLDYSQYSPRVRRVIDSMVDDIASDDSNDTRYSDAFTKAVDYALEDIKGPWIAENYPESKWLSSVGVKTLDDFLRVFAEDLGLKENTITQMAHDELEDDTDLMEDRLDERAGPVSVIRWGKPWLDAGSDGSKVSSTPDYTIDYTQENPNFQGGAHESDLETFYDYDDLGDFPGYDIPPTEDTQGLQKGSQCDLVNYKTAKPTLANTLAPDPEAPGSSGAEDDSDDTDDLLFGETEPEFVKDPYDLDYPNGNQTTKLSFPSVKQKKNTDSTEESDSETEVKHQKTLDRLEETVAKLSPTVILEHTDAEIKEACYSVADKHYGQRLNSSDIGILAHRVVHLLRNS